MMAPDQAPPPPGFDPDLLDSLRQELSRYLDQGDQSRELNDVLCRMTDEARARGIRAEQLLVILKHVWIEVLDSRKTPTKQQREELLRRVVSRCIEQYYDR